MKKSLPLLVAASFAFAFASGASALTKEEHKTQKDSIEATYKADKERCSSMSANAKDICNAEAKGKEKVAKAELEAQFKPSPKATA
ncbi:MAG: hypothetical protein EOP38_28665, partial [Rubrivivax sp.]